MSFERFLNEEEAKILEMARAWKKHGLAGPYKLESGEMGSMLDVLAQYVVEDGEIPTHYIHLGQITERSVQPVKTDQIDLHTGGAVPDPKLGPAQYVAAGERQSKHGPQFKFGIHPGSATEFNTPVGIYSYPLTRQIFNNFKDNPGRGLVAYAAESPHVLLFKPREGLPVLYSSRDIPLDEYKEYVKKLFSDEFIAKQHKINKQIFKKKHGWTKGKSEDELDAAIDGQLKFLHDGRKQIDNLEHGKWLWGPHLQNFVADKAIEIYEKKVSQPRPRPSGWPASKRIRAQESDRAEGKVRRFRAALHPHTWRPRHYMGTPSRSNETIEYEVARIAEQIVMDGILKPMFTQYPFGEPDPNVLTDVREDLTGRFDRWIQTKGAAIMSWDQRELSGDDGPWTIGTTKARDIFYDFVYELSLSRPGGEAIVEAAKEIINSQEGQDRWFDDEDTDWVPSDIEVVADAEASSRSYLKATKGELGRGKSTTVSNLWNLTRLAANESPMRWNAVIRGLGIGGFVDDAGTNFIHPAEPVQGVFFSKRDPDINLTLVDVFPNEQTPDKFGARRDWAPKMEFKEIALGIMEKIYPEFQPSEKWLNKLAGVDHITSIMHQTPDAWTMKRRLEIFKKNDPIAIVYTHAAKEHAKGAANRIKGLNEDFNLLVTDNAGYLSSVGAETFTYYRKDLKPGDQAHGDVEQPWLNFIDQPSMRNIRRDSWPDHPKYDELYNNEDFEHFRDAARDDVASVNNHHGRFYNEVVNRFENPGKHHKVREYREQAETRAPEASPEEIDLRVMEEIRVQWEMEREFIDREYVQKFKGIRDRAIEHVQSLWELYGPRVLAAMGIESGAPDPGEPEPKTPDLDEPESPDAIAKDEFTTEVMDEVKEMISKRIPEPKARHSIYATIEEEIVEALLDNTAEEARARKAELIGFAKDEIEKHVTSFNWKPGMPTPLSEQKKEVKHLHLNYLGSKWDWVID